MKGIIELMCEALQDETLRILQVAAVVSIIIETGTADESHRSSAWVEGFAIIVAILVCASVTAINDYQKVKFLNKKNCQFFKNFNLYFDDSPFKIFRDNFN